MGWDLFRSIKKPWQTWHAKAKKLVLASSWGEHMGQYTLYSLELTLPSREKQILDMVSRASLLSPSPSLRLNLMSARQSFLITTLALIPFSLPPPSPFHTAVLDLKRTPEDCPTSPTAAQVSGLLLLHIRPPVLPSFVSPSLLLLLRIHEECRFLPPRGREAL